MNKPTYDYAIAGGSCAAFLDSMVAFNAIPEHHLEHAKRLVADWNAAHDAWRMSIDKPVTA
jgi:hypothetical protein